MVIPPLIHEHPFGPYADTIESQTGGFAKCHVYACNYTK